MYNGSMKLWLFILIFPLNIYAQIKPDRETFYWHVNYLENIDGVIETATTSPTNNKAYYLSIFLFGKPFVKLSWIAFIQR